VDIGTGALILDNKSRKRGRLGVVLEQGYKYEPLVFVIGIGTISQQTGPVPTFESFSRVVELFERSHQSVTMISIMRWI
jgi:hypothetical protein